MFNVVKTSVVSINKESLIVNLAFLVDILKSIVPTSIHASVNVVPWLSKIWNLNLLSVNVPTILLLVSRVKYTSLLITLFVNVFEVSA